MNEVIMNQAYVPSDAENGKFAVVNPSTLSAMGLTGSYGRYAIITYDIAGNTSSGVLGTSGNPIYTNMMTIVSSVEVSLTGFQMSEIISAVNCTVSTLEINPITSISAYQAGLWNIDTLTSIISNVNVVIVDDYTVPNTLWIGSSALVAGIEYTPALPNDLIEIEIQNKTEAAIYFLASATNYGGVSANGIIIEPDTFYSTKKYMSEITIGSLSGGDVRILGYYRT